MAIISFVADTLTRLQYTWILRGFGLAKIPMLAFLWPKIESIEGSKVTVRIPLTKRSKNHVGSMYFGALACGADLSVGALALFHMRSLKISLHFVFKDFTAEFLKRATEDVLFICNEGDAIRDLVLQANNSGERVHATFNAFAALASSPHTPIAQFKLTLSLKNPNP
ncbi:MAG: YiiD C-terminal domain-containing protein [Pseudobdellovibrionaceae bacterium]|nr:YiiD C-terminal domain-containing protein [Bdellovibrionales bacterium]USN47910.1 MAG: YiiD C-terminal domain-containing protein [Pseudobdellovibrionaceae bacterium]